MTSSVSLSLLWAQSDRRLLELARDGHERAFEALVRRYHKQLLAYGRRLLPAAVAEDAVQQSLLQAWLALQRGTEVRDPAPWLYRIIYHSAIRIRRASGDDRARLATAAAADAPYVELERLIAARDALAGVAALPALQREALLQTVLDGRTHHQVAETLGLTDGAVRGLLYRARTTLRAAATALTPSPLVMWAVQAAGGRSSSSEKLPEVASTLSEIAGGPGGVSVAAALGKGGAIAISAGVLAAGTMAVHSKLPLEHSGATDHARVTTADAPDGAVPDVDAGLRFAFAPGSTRTVATEATSPVARPSDTATSSQDRAGVGGGGEVSATSHQTGATGAPSHNARPSTPVSVGTPSPMTTTGNSTPNTHPPAAGNAGLSDPGNTAPGAPSHSDNNAGEDNTSSPPTGATTTTATPDGSDNGDEGQSPATSTPGGAVEATAAAATASAAPSGSDSPDDTNSPTTTPSSTTTTPSSTTTTPTSTTTTPTGTTTTPSTPTSTGSD